MFNRARHNDKVHMQFAIDNYWDAVFISVGTVRALRLVVEMRY
jgi:hypothetical protein